jgi:hypothetical protein
LSRLARAAAAAAVLIVLLVPASAGANHQRFHAPPTMTKPPEGRKLTGNQVLAIAENTNTVQRYRREHPRMEGRVFIDTGRRGNWVVRLVDNDVELVEVDVWDKNGAVLDVFTGPQVLWSMARGTPGAFGRKLNAPYVWLPLCLLFFLPFFDPRRPFRLLHLDLLVMLGFGVSHIWFNRGEISTSTPLVYPVLAYLLVRALTAGFRPRQRAGPLVPIVPAVWLAIGALFLTGFRIGLNVADSNVIDVGYASILGADRIMDGKSLYGWDLDWHPDTYGPVNYLAYIPFEQVFPASGGWDELAGAHAAAITFDLLVLLGLLILGRRMKLGAALAYAWAAFPYTAFTLMSNANDTLIAVFVVWALVALSSPPVRGMLVTLGGLAKFAPLALAPLFARGRGDDRAQGWIAYAAAVALTLLLVGGPFVADVGWAKFYDDTFGYQAARPSPFSIWGLHDSLDWLRPPLMGAAIALAVLVAFVPRRRTTAQVAALAAAVLIAVQITASHWFYLYIVWFAPLLFAALFSEHSVKEPRAAAGSP